MWRLVLILFAILPFLWPYPDLATATDLSPTELKKIEVLVSCIEWLTDARFVRNGKDYSAAAAAEFLRRKWQTLRAEVCSAEDFIDRVASFSSTTGKPYFIRFGDGREVPSAEFLRAHLFKLQQ
jgi:hypothetical protein